MAIVNLKIRKSHNLIVSLSVVGCVSSQANGEKSTLEQRSENCARARIRHVVCFHGFMFPGFFRLVKIRCQKQYVLDNLYCVQPR